MRKLISVVLSMLIIISCITVAIPFVSAEIVTGTHDGLTYEISNGEVTITDAEENRQSIEIPDEIEGYPVTSIGHYAFKGCSSLTQITIPDSVSSIGAWAFYNCSSLTEIVIPSGVSFIGWQAFYGCSRLKNIFVNNGNTAFYDIDGVLINNFNELLVYPLGKKLSKYVIPDGVSSIGDSAFENCTSLTQITIPDSVSSIDWYAFDGCSSLTEIIIPDSVSSIGGYAFVGCTSLTEITIPESVTFIDGGLFLYINNLTVYGKRGSAIERYIAENYSDSTNVRFMPITFAEIQAPSTADVNERFNIEVKTYNDVEKVKIYNEKDSVIGSKVVSKTSAEDGTMTKWVLSLSIGSAGNGRTFTVKDSDGYELDTFTIDIVKPVSVTAPEKAKVNEAFTIELQTDSSVKKPIIVNENGGKIGSTIVSKETSGNVITWTISLSVGSVGENRIFSIADSSVSNPPLASFTIKIYDVETSIISVTAPETVNVGESFEVTTVVTSDLIKGKFVSENGNTIGSKVVSKVKDNKITTVVYSISIGSVGENRKLTFLADFDKCNDFPYSSDFYLNVV